MSEALFRTEVDFETGEAVRVYLTPEEIAALPPSLPPPVPAEVEVWKFMTAAWQMGFITQAEALAAIKDKVIPPVFAEALVDLPAQAQASVQLKFAGITKMVRADPLFRMIVAANKATDAQLDAVFTLADSIT